MDSVALWSDDSDEDILVERVQRRTLRENLDIFAMNDKR